MNQESENSTADFTRELERGEKCCQKVKRGGMWGDLHNDFEDNDYNGNDDQDYEYYANELAIGLSA